MTYSQLLDAIEYAKYLKEELEVLENMPEKYIQRNDSMRQKELREMLNSEIQYN